MTSDKSNPNFDNDNPSDLPEDLLAWAKGNCEKTTEPWRHPDTKVVIWHLVLKTYEADEEGDVKEGTQARDDLQIPKGVSVPETTVLAEVREMVKSKGREVFQLRVEAEILVRSPHAKAML